ncbi:MAG: acylphosphatase [Planctomycetota bacterium]|jgi:acylphosphatase
MNQTAKRIVFVGRVQGVGFRFTAYNIAKRHGLAGYVRNLLDGTVEMLAQGPTDDIDNCLSDLNETFQGDIRETKIQDTPPDPKYSDFIITF